MRLVAFALVVVTIAGTWTLALTHAGDNSHARYVYETTGGR